MPNWVTHRFVAKGSADALKDFAQFCFSYDKEASLYFDFNRIIPMPLILNRTVSGFGFSELEDKLNQKALVSTGHVSWYEWATENWGTKWNSDDTAVISCPAKRDTEASILEFTFNTAWSPPEPIFNELAFVWSDVEFDVFAFDEGWMFAYEGHSKDGIFSSKGWKPSSELNSDLEFYEKVYGQKYEAYEEE